MNIMTLAPKHYPKLELFLYHALHVPAGQNFPHFSAIYHPNVYLYVDGFGSERGDLGAVSMMENQVVGMAWTRIIPAYGQLDRDTPELAISVLPMFRGQGIGHRLMEHLFEVLREEGFSRTSLSVQKSNPAVGFYEDLGYKVVLDKGAELLMVRELGELWELLG